MAENEIRILVVCTDAAHGERLTAVFERKSPTKLHIFNCCDANDVLPEVTAHNIDAVVFALSRPDTLEVDTVARVCALVPETVVVAMVDGLDEELGRRLIRAGVQDVVYGTGYNAEDLLLRFRNAVERQRLMVEQARQRHHLEVANQRFRQLISDRFRSLVMDNADAMMVLDKGGNICFVNPAAEKLMPMHTDQLIADQFGKSLNTNEETEIEIPCPDGTKLVAAMRIMETEWEGEGAYTVTLWDVTERKRLEKVMRAAKQTAERANRMKSLFLANMSHELRTPLNAIIGFSELMGAETFGPMGSQKYVEYARHITESGGHLLGLINDLLDLSKAEAGKLDLHEEEFDLNGLLIDMVEVMRMRADAGKVGLSIDLPDETLYLRADRLKLRQITLNLLSNAIKFTPEHGQVRVTARSRADGRTIIKVADTGVGMPSDQIPKAFAAFTQCENAWTKKLTEGSGLGLALTKRLVELHGGAIGLKSEVGAGTIATVVFPAERRRSVPAADHKVRKTA